MIRVECRRCGPVELRPDELVVDAVRYRYRCPSCGEQGSGWLAPGERDLLARVGVRVLREDPSLLGRFTEAHVVQFARLLDSHDWFENLAASIDL